MTHCSTALRVLIAVMAFALVTPGGAHPQAAPGLGAVSIRWRCRLGSCDRSTEGPPREDPTRWICPTCPASALVMVAFGLDNTTQISGVPGWMNSDAYQVQLTTTAPATHAQMMKLLQSAVVKAFGLRYRIDQAPARVYKLTVASGGPKFQPTNRTISMTRDALLDGYYDFGSVADLVNWLNRLYYGGADLQHAVVDGTGLSGRYDIRLKLGAGAFVNRAPLMDLVQKQLGLKAEVVPGQTKSLTIEAVERLGGSWTSS